MSHAIDRRQRLLALDAFRGATVAGMLLVNDPGSWSEIYPPLQHAVWHGWTPTDLIFPFFLYIVGVTTHLSRAARRVRGDPDGIIVRQVIRRSLLIIGAGLLLASFPWWPLERITEVRIPGVLQRIGVAYLAGALLTMKGTLKAQVLVLVFLLYGYWFAMTLLPVPGRGGPGYLLLDNPEASIAAWLDRAVFGTHLWASSVTWDPEGLLSTVPAVGTVLLGVFTGRWLGVRRPLADRLTGLFGAGAIAMLLGLMWNWSFPINKQLWTSSYVLFTGGMAAVVLAACIWIIDMHGYWRWTAPFTWYGRNPLIAFLGSGVMARTIYSLIQVDFEGRQVPLQQFVHESVFASWMAPRDASLAFGLSFVALWAIILWALDRRGIYLKI